MLLLHDCIVLTETWMNMSILLIPKTKYLVKSDGYQGNQASSAIHQYSMREA